MRSSGYDETALRDLLCCVIEQAVADRRWAVTKGIIDDEAQPLPQLEGKVKANKHGAWVSLHYFFYKGGLETICNAGDLELPIGTIKEKSKEK